MALYEELILQKESLIDRRAALQLDIQEQNNLIMQKRRNLEAINSDYFNSIERAKSESLKLAIEKEVQPIEDSINELLNKRDIILKNKDKRLKDITYENYQSEIIKDLSIDDILDSCKKMYGLLEQRQGERLNDLLFEQIPSDDLELNSLEDVTDLIRGVEDKVVFLSKRFNVFEKLETLMYKKDVDSNNNFDVITFGIFVIVSLVSFVYFAPLFILVMLGLICFNVYLYCFNYKCIRLLNSISKSLGTIEESIIKIIEDKVKSDRDLVESKFNEKLRKIDSIINSAEDRISEISEEITNDFSYDPSGLKESFRVKEQSIKDSIELMTHELDSCKKSFSDIEEKLKEVEAEILKLSQSLFSKYYPLNIENKIDDYPQDMLLDIVDNKPIIFKLPRGSSILVFSNQDDLFEFSNLLLLYLYSNMRCCSFRLFYHDEVNICSNAAQYNGLNNFIPLVDSAEYATSLSEMNKELKKRINILVDREIFAYNKEMLEEGNATMSYNILLDFFVSNNTGDADYKQVVVNGFNRGLIPIALVLKNEIDTRGNGPFWDMLNLYDEIYEFNGSRFLKKSKMSYEKLRK